MRTNPALLLTLLLPATVLISEPKLHYTVSVNDRWHHFIDVTILAEGFRQRELDFAMPAWSPGRYVIYDFAKNFSNVTATDKGKALPITRVDKQTWRVDLGEGGGCKLQYRVFANTLSGTFSQANEEHVNFNGASLFMYVVDHKHVPVTLELEVPEGWSVATGLPSAGRGHSFRAANYDILIDSPVEMGKFHHRQFEVLGKKHHLIVHKDGRENNLEALVADLKKIVQTAERVLRRGLPYDDYWFIMHFAPHSAMGDGMEHLNSAQIVQRSELADMTFSASDKNYENLIALAAHEYFHLWNVKRIRPSGLGPFDYSREVYSRNLWIAEGLTSYYAALILKRMGFHTDRDFLRRFATQISQFEQHPGKLSESAETNSFLSWFFIRTPKPAEDNMVEQHFLSYYNQGMLLGLLLDLEIRHSSAGKHSLDDVFAALYDRFYVTQPESYYLQGKSYEAEDFQRIAEEMAGASLDEFFSAYVRGTEPLDYDRHLDHAGLKLQKTEYLKPGEVGILWQEGGAEALQIKHIEPNSVADEAGLDRGDIVLGVNDYMVTQSKWESRFEDLKEGDRLKFLVERRGRVLEFSASYRTGKGISYDIVPLDTVTEAQSQLRKEWLGVD